MGSPTDAEHRKDCLTCTLRWALGQFAIAHPQMSDVDLSVEGSEACAAVTASVLVVLPPHARERGLMLQSRLVMTHMTLLDLQDAEKRGHH